MLQAMLLGPPSEVRLNKLRKAFENHKKKALRAGHQNPFRPRFVRVLSLSKLHTHHEEPARRAVYLFLAPLTIHPSCVFARLHVAPGIDPQLLRSITTSKSGYNTPRQTGYPLHTSIYINTPKCFPEKSLWKDYHFAKILASQFSH